MTHSTQLNLATREERDHAFPCLLGRLFDALARLLHLLDRLLVGLFGKIHHGLGRGTGRRALAGSAGAAGTSRDGDTSGCAKGSSAVQGTRFTIPSQSNTVPRFTLHVAWPPSFAMAVTHSICKDCPPRGCAPSMTQR